VNLELAPPLMAALHHAIDSGLVRACHDLSEGGLAVAAAEMAFAGGLGLDLTLPGNLAAAVALFSESPSRFLAEVHPDRAAAFEQTLHGFPLTRIGTVTTDPTLVVRAGVGSQALIYSPIKELRAAAHVRD
jgi:phosphoribosylformylglycinamidine synthase